MTNITDTTHSRISLNGPSTLELEVQKPAELHDMLFIPSLQAILPLCKQYHDTLLHEAERFEEAMIKIDSAQQALTDWRAKQAANMHSTPSKNAQQDELQHNIQQAQEDLRDLLTHYVWPGLDESIRQARLRQESGLFNAQKSVLNEVYSITNKRLLWVSTNTLKELSTRIPENSTDGVAHPNLYRIPASNPSDQDIVPVKTLSVDVFDQRQQQSTADALKPWRDPSSAQALSQTNFRTGYQQAALQVALNWNLVDREKQGTLSSKTLLRTISPKFASLLCSESFEALDSLIDGFNTAANAQHKRYEQRRDALLDILNKRLPSNANQKRTEDRADNEGVLPEEWAFIVREVKDIWWNGWTDLEDFDQAHPENDFQAFARSISLEDNPRNRTMRDHIKQRLASQPLPPVRLDASAGAQMLRYSMAAKARGSLSLSDNGFLGVEGTLGGELNLLEAKTEFNTYLPHSEGYRLRLRLPAYAVHLKWAAQPKTSLMPSQPTFIDDSDFIQPEGLVGLLDLFKDWNLQKGTLSSHRTNADGANVLLQVVTTANDLNAHQRAETAYGYLSFQPGIWVQRFVTGAWGEAALHTLLRAVYAKRTEYKYLATQEDFEREINSKIMTDPVRLIEARMQGQSLVSWEEQMKLLHNHLTLFPLDSDPALQPHDKTWITENLIDAAVTIGHYAWTKHRLGLLIICYFRGVGTHPKNLMPKVAFWDQLPFTTTTCPSKLCVPDRIPANSISLVPYHIIDDSREQIDKEFLFGDTRIRLTGTLQGAAGVNAQLAGKILLDIDKDKMLLAGLSAAAMGVEDIAIGGEVSRGGFDNSKKIQRQSQHYSDEATLKSEVKGSLFVGLRAEAGLRTALEWRPPKQNNNAIPPWCGLADLGFAVTGLLGAGLAGDFSIGYDGRSQRFQIKIQGELCLGKGVGGGLSFGVGVGVMFDFFKLVYRQLQEGDFNYLAIFEGDAFERLNALAYELLEKGHVLQAGLTFIAGGALQETHTALQDLDNTIELWQNGMQFRAERAAFVRTVTEHADHLSYLTPEVKGRILFRLLTFKRENQNRWLTPGEIMRVDKDYLVEEAALTLITRGIHSAREWQETMEHMAYLDPTTETLTCIIPEQCSQTEKAERYRKNQRLVTEELIDGRLDLSKLWRHLERIGVPQHA